jgi:hypothetical protein
MSPSYHPIQKWTSDMWSVLWNGWYFGYTIKVDPYLNFTWATDPISKWNDNLIYHNAGVVGTGSNFYKGEFMNTLPYFISDTFSKDSASYNYFKEVIEIGKNTCLTQNSNTSQGCFASGTLITMSDGSLKPIESILESDIVSSMDLNGNVVNNTITGISNHVVDKTILLTINNITNITTTTEHPFKVGSSYIRTDQLRVGNKLTQLTNGLLYQVVLNNIIYIKEESVVYNITSYPDHTYFANGICVHNKY